MEWEDIARIPELAVSVSLPQVQIKPETERMTIKAMCSARKRARRTFRSVIQERFTPSVVRFLTRTETVKLGVANGEYGFERKEVHRSIPEQMVLRS